jgi:hypothetical protein
VWYVKPYNYGRFNFWQVIGLSGNCVLAFVLLIAVFIEIDNSVAVFFSVLGMWVALIIFGVVYQKMKSKTTLPGLLYSEKVKNFNEMVRFQFVHFQAEKTTELFTRRFSYLSESSVFRFDSDNINNSA